MKLDAFIHSLSEGLLASGLFRKCEIYASAMRSVFRFCGNEFPPLDVLFTPVFLRDCESYLIRTCCSRNTISFYMSALRSINSRAVDAGLIPPVPGLFACVFTGIEVTRKRAILPETLSHIIVADLSDKPRLQPCRDYLLLAFLLQGMSFIDLAHLRKSDLQGDTIRYYRQKTSTLVEVAVLPDTLELLNRYAGSVHDSPYLLPLVTLTGKEGRRQYQSALHRQNRQLKELAAYLGIADNLTSYSARHSWATIAYHNDVEVSVVGQGMGHGTEQTTRIYLSTFSLDRLREANYITLAAVLRPVVEGAIKNVSPAALEQAKKQYAEARVCLTESKRQRNQLLSPDDRGGSWRYSRYK